MMIKKGDKGPNVTKIQKALDAAGFWTYGKFTEVFGPVTEDAVKKFQSAKGLIVDGEVGPNTMHALGITLEEPSVIQEATAYTLEQVKSAVKSKGYFWFEDDENKGYDVNIVGIRNMASGDKVTNVFDDWITISYKEDGQWKFYCWNATTDPGKKGVMQFHNKKGVARLVPGQYKSWSIDKHQGKYEALCQRLNKVKVWRDSDRDLVFENMLTDEGMFGINIHKAGKDSTWVENWSEGCQVFKRVKDFDVFMSICKKAAKIHGNAFSYTLITSEDI